jgi:hypothetical protein
MLIHHGACPTVPDHEPHPSSPDQVLGVLLVSGSFYESNGGLFKHDPRAADYFASQQSAARCLRGGESIPTLRKGA